MLNFLILIFKPLLSFQVLVRVLWHKGLFGQRGFSLIEVLVGTSLASMVFVGTLKVSQVYRQMSEVSKAASVEQELKAAMVRVLGEENECRNNLNPLRLQGEASHAGVGEVLSLVRYNRPGSTDDVPLLSRGSLFNDKIELVKMELRRDPGDKDSDPKAHTTKRNFVVYYKKKGLGHAQTLENKPCTTEDTTHCYFAQCSLNYRLENKKTNPGVLDCEALNCLAEASGYPECYTVDYEEAQQGDLNKGHRGRTLVGCGGTSGIEKSATTAMGYGAGTLNTEGAYNTFLGSYAGEHNTEGKKNMFLGAYAGRYNTLAEKKTNSNTFVGVSSGRHNKGHLNTFLGGGAGVHSTQGLGKTFIGYGAGRGTNTKGFDAKNRYFNAESDNLFLGVHAGIVNEQGGNTFIGHFAAGAHPVTKDDTIHGQKLNGQVYYLPTQVKDSVFIGTCSGYNAHSGKKDGGTRDNIFLGPFTGFNSNSVKINKAPTCISQPLGKDKQSKDASEKTTSNYPDPKKHFLGEHNIFIGHRAGAGDLTTGGFNVFMGTKAGHHNSEGQDNTFIGKETGFHNTTAAFNTFVGSGAGFHIKGGKYDQNFMSGARARHNHFLGWQSGYGCLKLDAQKDKCTKGENVTGLKNVFLGSRAGFKNITGTHNVFIGNRAGRKNTTGHFNVAVGSAALRGDDENESGANFNTVLGWLAGTHLQGNPSAYDIGTEHNLKRPGDFNISVGYVAAGPSSGSGNVFIGKKAGVFQASGYGNIYIGSRGSDKGRLVISVCQNDKEVCKIDSVGPHQGGDHSKSAGIKRDGSYQLNIGNLLIGKMPQDAHSSPSLDHLPGGSHGSPHPGLIVNGNLCVKEQHIKTSPQCKGDIIKKVSTSLPDKIKHIENLIREWRQLSNESPVLNARLAQSQRQLILAKRRYQDRRRQQQYMQQLEKLRQKKEEEQNEALLKQKPVSPESQKPKSLKNNFPPSFPHR